MLAALEPWKHGCAFCNVAPAALCFLPFAMWGFSSAPSPTGLLPRGFVLQRARVCVVAFLKALLEMPFCIGGWKQGNAMGALCIGSFCHERAETVLVRMQPWCWLSTMVLLALAPTAISTSLHNANLVCSKCFVATDIHEVLAWLHHLKNKNKTIECLPAIEPWLAG